MCFSSPSGSASVEATKQAAQAEQERADEAKAQETDRQNRITGATDKANSYFNLGDDFYKNRADAYVNYAEPQLQDQYKLANDDLTYALSRAGTLDSSGAGTAKAKLLKQYELADTNIKSTGQQYANDARSSVENSRLATINSINNADDPDSAALAAPQRIAAASATPMFSPLGQLFQNLTAGIATGANSYQANSPGNTTFADALFGKKPNQTSSQIVS